MAGDKILDEMLMAAETAAGANWNTIKPDLLEFAQRFVLEAAATIADLAAGKISQDEANIQLQPLGERLDITSNYASNSVQISAETAANAAIQAYRSVVLRSVSALPGESTVFPAGPVRHVNILGSISGLEGDSGAEPSRPIRKPKKP
jgi:hypothetical protein